MRKFGLIGKTLHHSFSKTFFTSYFEREKVDAEYCNFELSEIEEILPLFHSNSVSGLNVTIPYKQSVIPFLDELSIEAKEIGAVNVIQFKDGKTIGHNSDAFGFHQSIKPFLTNLHERALIIGTGGASKAVEYVFKSLGIDTFSISRNPYGDKQFSYSEINNHMLNSCKVIVHCTPVGTFPNEEDVIEFPFEYLTKDHLVIDLIYNPIKTKFLRLAEEHGATILNGESMLHQQALKAWEIWNLK
jgi:shikimate dehydrogenase